jgi:hypothetical protein
LVGQAFLPASVRGTPLQVGQAFLPASLREEHSRPLFGMTKIFPAYVCAPPNTDRRIYQTVSDTAHFKKATICSISIFPLFIINS